MALVLDVLTHIDERSAAESARQLQRQFEEGGHEAGERFGGNLIEGMTAGFHSGNFDSLTGVLESAGMTAQATRSGEAIGVAFAAGITVAAGAALVDLGVKVGETFEGINRQIELHTAASGKALDELKSHADALVGSMDSATNNLGNDMATLGTRLQMGAGAALDQLTQHVEMLRDRMGNFDVGALSGALHNMGVSGADADNVLASLVATVQRTDVPLSELVNTLAANSDLFRDLHLTAGQAANMLGEIGAKGVPANTAIMGLQMGMKTAKAEGEDFNTFIRRISDSLDYYAKKGDEASAEQLSLAVGGPRKWADLQTAAHAYLDTVQQGAGAFQGQSQQLDDLQKNTRNLHNQWELVENRIKAALAPVALNVVDDIAGKMDSFIGWLNAHQDDLRKSFESSIDVIEHVMQTLGEIASTLGQHPALIHAVVDAFEGWAAIRGISAVANAIEGILTTLKLIPEAATGAEAAIAGIEAAGGAGAAGAASAEAAAGAAGAGGLAAGGAAMGIADLPAGVIALPFAATAFSGYEAYKGIQQQDRAAQGTPGDTSHDVPWDSPDSPLMGGHAGAHGGPQAGPPAPGAAPPSAPAPAGVPGFFGGTMHPTGPAPGAPPAPGAVASGPDDTGGGPPSDLLTPADLDPKKGHKGPRLPGAPEVPYPAGYGAAPAPGETAERYEAEQRVLEQRHTVDEAAARLNQLEHDNNATQDDIQKARNDLLKAQGDENTAELRLYQDQTKQLGKHADEMGDLGAKIDKDFGVSKGLSGIADNLTKFLGNLMMAGPLAALNHIVEASGVKQAAPGAGGLIGMAAVSGALGPQFMPGVGSAGMRQGPFGGTPGFGADRGGAPDIPSVDYPGSISSAEDLQTAGGRVSALYSFAQSLAGTPYSMPLRNDCSGMVSRIASQALGLGDQAAGQRFSTANEGQWLSSHGFQSGMGGPDDLNIGWHIGGPAGGHTAATLPGGTNAEQGGSNPGFTLGPGAAGAGNLEFEYHAHLAMVPGQAQGPLQGPGAIPGPPMNTSASGAVLSGYSSGGAVDQGQLAVVGEKGPEYVISNKGTSTYPKSFLDAINAGAIPPNMLPHFGDGGSTDGDAPAQHPEATQIGGRSPDAGTGSGMPGGSGGALGAAGQNLVGAAPPSGMGSSMAAPMGGAASGMAAGAASMGIGLAAQIAMQEAQRAIQAAGQYAGIGWSALEQTFLPTGASQLAQNSWLTRIGGALMGAQPQIPNMAGKSQNKSAEGVSGLGTPMTPPQEVSPFGPSRGPEPGPAGAPGPQPPASGPPTPQPPSTLGDAAGARGKGADSLYGASTPDSVLSGRGKGADSLYGSPTPESVLPAPMPAAHFAQGGSTSGGANAPAVYIEQYHAHDNPDEAGRDIAAHTVATLAPPRGSSQYA